MQNLINKISQIKLSRGEIGLSHIPVKIVPLIPNSITGLEQ